MNQDGHTLKIKHGNWAEMPTPFRMDTVSIPTEYYVGSLYGKTEIQVEHNSYTKTQIKSKIEALMRYRHYYFGEHKDTNTLADLKYFSLDDPDSVTTIG